MMDFDQIVVKESPGLCRCCLSEGCYKDLGTEYPWMSDTEVYADMLLECFDISITQHNDGPNGPNRLICEVCITRLRDACNFKKQVMDSEKKFIDMVGRGEFRPKVLIYQEHMKLEEQAEESADEPEVEYLEDEMTFGDDDIAKEEAGESSTYEDITVSTLPVKGKRGRPKKNVVKTETKAKVPKMEDKPRTSKAVAKDEYPGPFQGCTSEKRRKNLQILFNHTTILPFKWRGKYLCFFCGKSYAEYPEFKKHTKSHGPCTTKDHSLKYIKGNHIEIKIDVSEIACEICNEPFLSFAEIINHLIAKHNLDYNKSIDIPYQEYRLVDFRCMHCEEQFSYFAYLVNHVNNMHPKNSFICDDCGITFNKKRDLSVHIRNLHRQGGYSCDQCSQTCDSYFTLRQHQNNTHFCKCNSCGLRFATQKLLRKHIQIDHPESSELKCGYCSNEFHTSQGLKQHIRKCKVRIIAQVDASNISFPVENKIGVEPKKKQNVLQIRQNIICVLNMSTAIPFKFFSKFSCFYCSQKFVEYEVLKEHTILEHPVCDLKSKCMRKCKGERITVKVDIACLACKICCLPMPDLDSFIDHVILEHKANYDKSITCLEPHRIIKDNMPCPLCPNITFRYFTTLLRHMNSEHNNNNRICDFCGKSFRTVTNLKVHISYTHTKSSECDDCGVKFKNQWCLSRHRAKSHNVKDFKCPKCPEQFESQYHKQKHLITSHDIGHKCTYCNKMFTRNSFMKDHIRRTHLKEKNVPCSVCNERFFDNHLLRMHMVKHKGERKFICDVCGKAFLRRSNLSSHKEMHKKYGHVPLQV